MGFLASDRQTPAAESLYRSIFKITTVCIAVYESYLSTVRTEARKYTEDCSRVRKKYPPVMVLGRKK
jgi:hypothetical protein